MSGAFAPADPSLLVAREYRDATGAGGTIVSPAFDLLDLATKLGLLKELRQRVARNSGADDGVSKACTHFTSDPFGAGVK